MKNMICMQIIKSHEKLHKPLAKFLEMKKKTVKGESFGCSRATERKDENKVKNCTSSEKWFPLALLIASALNQYRLC